MRPKLLKSFITVLVFWFIVTTLWWSFQKPEVNLEALRQLKGLMPFLPFEVPAEAKILDSLYVQKNVLAFWTLPLLVAVFLSGLAGYGTMWLKAKGKRDERTQRETGTGNFRGVTLTVGELPVPYVWPKDEIELDTEDESIAKLTDRQRILLQDILGTISAHPDAFAGEGVDVSLLEHTANIASKALEAQRNPGLSAIVAAAYELGKITAYKKNGEGEWVPFKKQDKEAAKILGAMNSWFQLPTQERNAVLMAVKYHSTPRLMPTLESDEQAYRMAREILSIAEGTQQEVVVEAKQKTLEKKSEDLPDVIFDTFLKSLPVLPFQNRGLPKGVGAVAWKVQNRVYLLEIRLRETLMAKLPADVRGALTVTGKPRLQPFTTELLKALEARGWLVTKIGDYKVDPKEALFNIKAGKLEFKGIIAVDVPADFRAALPADDSMYEIAVSGTLFSQGGGGGASTGMGMSRSDLSSVLRPAEKSVEKPAEKPSDKPVDGENV